MAIPNLSMYIGIPCLNCGPREGDFVRIGSRVHGGLGRAGRHNTRVERRSSVVSQQSIHSLMAGQYQRESGPRQGHVLTVKTEAVTPDAQLIAPLTTPQLPLDVFRVKPEPRLSPWSVTNV